MADVVTFDPDNLLIIEINSGSPAVNELDAVEVYSEWKDWLLADPSRLGHPQAFTPVGGDPRTLTQNLGITYFLENGWRIRPAEYSHKLAIVGNIFTREPGESIYVPTVGAYNVHTETVVSNIIDTMLTGSGLSAGQVTMLTELYRLAGLDATRPLVVTETTRDAGAEIEQTIAESPPGTITVTRT